jgi:hypothetical protein
MRVLIQRLWFTIQEFKGILYHRLIHYRSFYWDCCREIKIKRKRNVYLNRNGKYEKFPSKDRDISLQRSIFWKKKLTKKVKGPIFEMAFQGFDLIRHGL